MNNQVAPNQAPRRTQPQLTFQMNSPLLELLVCESESLSHSFSRSAAACAGGSGGQGAVGGEGALGGAPLNDVLIISVAGPGKNVKFFVL